MRPKTGPFATPTLVHRIIDIERRDSPSCSLWADAFASRADFMHRAAQESKRMQGSRGAMWAQSLQCDGAEAYMARRRA